MKFWQRGSISLRRRFTIGIAARVVPLVALTFGAIASLEYAIAAFNRSEEQTLEEIFPLKRLEESIFDASQPVVDYLSSGDRQLRDRFLAASQEIDYTFEMLLKSNREEQEYQRLILSSREAWRKLHQTGIDTFNYSYPVERQTLLRQYKLLDTDSREAIKRIGRVYNFLYHDRRASNLEQAHKLEQTVRLIANILLILELTIAGISTLILFRSIVVPLKNLEVGVKQLSDGNLDYRIDFKSPDEFGKLAATLNLMAQKLQQTQNDLRDLAIKDGLTGLLNRREFNRQLQAEIERSHRYSQDCSLLMMDIDYFKKLNDTYGHQGGDEALKTVASLLQKEVRPVDRVARYGGEEFAVILPQTSSEGAEAVAERLRHAIATHTIAVSEEQKINVTVSIGCATCPDNANSSESLISAADVALYTAKNSGRNRVVNFTTL